MCKQTTKVGDIVITEGSIITVPVYAIHHLEEYWPEPEVFNPERYSKLTVVVLLS